MKFKQKILAIQIELKAPKGQYNSFGKYKYRSCEDILEAVKPLCSKYGVLLSISDRIIMLGNRYYIQSNATLTDTGDTGEKFTVTALAREAETKKGMDESQITGASSSYARKYALNGLFCIDDTKDADSQENPAQGNLVSKKQLSELLDMIDSLGVDKKKFCKHFKVDSVNDLPASRYKEAKIALEAKAKKQKDKS